MASFEYDYEVTNPGQYAAEFRDGMNRRQADGWHVHTAALNYGEVALLWEREIPESSSEDTLENDGLVHVDWLMEPKEWSQLSEALRTVADVSPYVSQLMAEGKLEDRNPDEE